MIQGFVRLAFLLILFLPWRIAAADGDWQVAKATAQVKYTTDKVSWHPVRPGMLVPNGAWIATGPRGRAIVRRNVESITFHPQTLASIVTTQSTIRRTAVIQPQGMLDLEIEKRAMPHTVVETPFLAAVVKGTGFSVSINKRSAAVSVRHGLVGVKSFQTGQQADVGPGQSANVDARSGMTTAGLVSKPSITQTRAALSRTRATANSKASSAAQAADKSAGAPTSGAGTDGASTGKGGPAANGGKGPGKDGPGGKGGPGSDGGAGGKGEPGGKGGQGKDQPGGKSGPGGKGEPDGKGKPGGKGGEGKGKGKGGSK